MELRRLRSVKGTQKWGKSTEEQRDCTIKSQVCSFHSLVWSWSLCASQTGLQESLSSGHVKHHLHSILFTQSQTSPHGCFQGRWGKESGLYFLWIPAALIQPVRLEMSLKTLLTALYHPEIDGDVSTERWRLLSLVHSSCLNDTVREHKVGSWGILGILTWRNWDPLRPPIGLGSSLTSNAPEITIATPYWVHFFFFFC